MVERHRSVSVGCDAWCRCRQLDDLLVVDEDIRRLPAAPTASPGRANEDAAGDVSRRVVHDHDGEQGDADEEATDGRVGVLLHCHVQHPLETLVFVHQEQGRLENASLVLAREVTRRGVDGYPHVVHVCDDLVSARHQLRKELAVCVQSPARLPVLRVRLSV